MENKIGHKKVMFRVAIMGAGINFQRVIGSLLERQKRGEIELVVVMAENVYADKIFGIPFRNWDDVCVKASCVILAEDGDEFGALKRLKEKGVGDDFIVPWQALFIPGFTFEKYLALKRSHISIIANMCWGGCTYHYFKLPFLSPFINMFLTDEDYIKLLGNLRGMLDCPLELVREEYNPGAMINYPVYKMGEVELWMNHYSDYELAKKKFDERRKRINWDNIFVMMYATNPKIAEEFETLPYDKKICLTNFHTDLPSALYLEFSKAPYFQGKGDWVFNTGVADGVFSFYDPWEIMLESTHAKRWSEGLYE